MKTERNPMSLSNEDLTAVMQQWRKLHPVGSRDNDSSSPLKPLEQIYREQGPVYREVIGDVGRLLSADSLAELKAIFSIGRDREPPEELRELAVHNRREFGDAVNLEREIAQLLEKTNFLTSVCDGLIRLGRGEMAASLSQI